jgi:hypothetical protein
MVPMADRVAAAVTIVHLTLNPEVQVQLGKVLLVETEVRTSPTGLVPVAAAVLHRQAKTFHFLGRITAGMGVTELLLLLQARRLLAAEVAAEQRKAQIEPPEAAALAAGAVAEQQHQAPPLRLTLVVVAGALAYPPPTSPVQQAAPASSSSATASPKQNLKHKYYHIGVNTKLCQTKIKTY